jgi:thioredoxin reductase (NADPH)
MQQQAESFGAETEYAEVSSLDLRADPKVIETSEGTFYGRTVVYATGAGPRELGLSNEQQLVGRGVAYCAACDGMFYKGKTVVLVGGGNSAAADALLLSRVAKKVILVHRRDSLRAEKAVAAAVEQNPNIEIRWNAEVVRILEKGRVTGVVIRDVNSGEEREEACDGLFVSIGRKPSTELFRGQISLDDAGYIVAGEDTKTNVAGVFAAGDARTKAVRQIVTATADGAVAAWAAERFLTEG